MSQIPKVAQMASLQACKELEASFIHSLKKNNKKVFSSQTSLLPLFVQARNLLLDDLIVRWGTLFSSSHTSSISSTAPAESFQAAKHAPSELAPHIFLNYESDVTYVFLGQLHIPQSSSPRPAGGQVCTCVN